MPRVGITAYDLLLSCPGDVIGYLDAIKDSVANFNRVFGVINNIEVVTKHWSTDSYPQSGDKPQELLNKQFVYGCDAAVAIFWSRFGSPTDKYGSGTEEEIEEMLSAGKQVFMYFLDKEVSLSEINIEQYKKVQDFKDKYKDKGIYFVVKNEHELQQLFTNHLGLHFLPIITGKSDSKITKNPMPLLKIRDASDFSNDIFQVHKFSLNESKFIFDRLEEIINNITKVQESKIPARLPKIVEQKAEFSQLEKSLQKMGLSQFDRFRNFIDAEIDNSNRETILNFAQRNNIVIDDDFWNVGELKKQGTVLFSPFGSNEVQFEGTDTEKDRYKLLMDIYWKIIDYNEYINYFTVLSNKKYIRCVLSNIGTTFDEDVDIKLIIEKDCICSPNSIPIPEINIIEEINDMNLLDNLFNISENESIDAYSGFCSLPQDYSDMLPSTNLFNTMNAAEQYKKDKRKYNNKVNNIFCYKTFQTDKNDVWCFQIQYLKHNTNMAFPSILIFNKMPEYIEYEINSKHMPEVIQGRIELSK